MSGHDATLSFDSAARSPNRVPQALTHGWMRVQADCLSFDETGL
ncbi:hypothetical protein P367_02685 [Comamonas thiooxydans]|nr:hypothetical protein P369_10990 [Comamonas thiooxydans]KGH02520.1 hypothetical protein P367_02685 [Comamonas thiooxydans]